MKKWVYIDYENMSGLKSLPKIEGQYLLFIGATQNTLSKSLLLSAQENNGKFIEISGTGKNALDFHIAYQFGEDIQSIIEELYRIGFISKSNKTITYSE